MINWLLHYFIVFKCVNCALHVAGFVESIPSTFYKSDPNYEALIGVGLVIIILFVNIAGVKWVVRVQFIILIVLVSTILNFAVGLFVKKDAGLFLLWIGLLSFIFHLHLNSSLFLFYRARSSWISVSKFNWKFKTWKHECFENIQYLFSCFNRYLRWYQYEQWFVQS